MLFRVNVALIDVNVAQSKLVLLENFNENYSKCLRLLYKVNAAEGVNAASEEVSTAELVSTAYSKHEHEEHLKLILEFLKKEELYVKFSKCEFWIPKVQFLGHVIDSKGIHVDPSNIESIKDWASLKLPTEIRQFLGAENFIIYCDASHKGLGDVLMQNDKQILEAQTEARKPKNLGARYGGMLIENLRESDNPDEKLERVQQNAFLNNRSLVAVLIDLMDLIMHEAFQKALGTRLDMSTAYHPQTDGQSERTIQTLEDMLRACVIDFRNEVRDAQLTGLELIHKTTEKIVQIKQRIQAARDRQKSYVDVRRKPLEIQVGDRVMLKVSPWKEVIHFGKRGKLNPSPLAIPLDEIHIDDKLHFVKEPVEIMDRKVKRLKQGRISIIKVRWNSRRGPEFTWETERSIPKINIRISSQKPHHRQVPHLEPCGQGSFNGGRL
ncbi:putative reverse transcriptase domain-containing protein [Tanacetum coccineum]